MSVTSLELRSEITPAGQLSLSLEERRVAAPGVDEVVVLVEAVPIPRADLAELLGAGDVATPISEATVDRPLTTAEVPPRLLPLAGARLGKSLAVGLEGAGVVVHAGANALHRLGTIARLGEAAAETSGPRRLIDRGGMSGALARTRQSACSGRFRHSYTPEVTST